MGRGELGFNFKVAFLWGFLFNLFSLTYCSVIYEITSSTPLLPGKYLISPNQNFELGFFSPNPNHPNFQYVGLWFKEISPRTVVWVANRENPITDSSASLTIGNDGNLLLLDGQKKIIWSTKLSNPLNDSFGSISDEGLFTLKDRKAGNQLWDCFQDPTDSLLAQIRFIFSETNGRLPTFQSWKSANDPSPGDFTANIPPRSPPQIVIWKGSKPHFRTGPWDKTKFIGVPEMHTNYDSGLQLGGGDSQQSIVFNFPPLYKYSRFTLLPDGVAKFLCWTNEMDDWFAIWKGPVTPCAIYGACGSFGVCQRDEPKLSCRCLKGFVPKSNEEWNKGNWSGGCVRRSELNCGRNTSSTSTPEENSDGF